MGHGRMRWLAASDGDEERRCSISDAVTARRRVLMVTENAPKLQRRAFRHGRDDSDDGCGVSMPRNGLLHHLDHAARGLP